MPDFVSHVCLQYFPFRAFVTMICWTSTEALLNLVAPLDSAVLTLDFEQINTFELPVMIPLVFSGWPAVLEFLEFHFLINKIYSLCVNAKHSLKWWIFENLLLVAWTEKKDFWSRVVHWSETVPCFVAVNSVRLWLNYFLRSGKQKTEV